jgi:Alginate lyase
MTIVTTPGQVLDLSRWKITLPTGAQNNPDEVHYPALSNLVTDHFHPLKAVAFRNYAGGDPAPPGGSHYARSELREMNTDGSATAWSAATGTHTMTVVQRVTRIHPNKPVVVVNQIHCSPDYFFLCVLDGRSPQDGTLKLYSKVVDDNVGYLDTDYKLGTWFTCVVQVVNGVLNVYYNGVLKTTTPISSYPGLDYATCYYKAGSYGQSSTDPAFGGDDAWSYAEVEISSIILSHS